MVLQPARIPCLFDDNCTTIQDSRCIDDQCKCPVDLPVFIADPPLCLPKAQLNTSCLYTEQCMMVEELSVCSSKKLCVCAEGNQMKTFPDYAESGQTGLNCVYKSGGSDGTGVDPAMIGVLVGLALMFVIICVVLRLFSKARFRENRSIFNTPNPRLMNASLFKDSKLLSPGRGDRRGSRASVRAPSRTASIASMNKELNSVSSNGSLAKERRGSGLSTGSTAGISGTPTLQPKAPSPGKEDKPEEAAIKIESVD